MMFWITTKAVSRDFITKKKADSNVDFNEISKQIDRLQKDKERLAIVENLITDLETFTDREGDEGNAYTLRWRDVTGTEHQYQFMIFGNESEHESLLEIANAERDRLRTSLSKEIQDLRFCVTQTSRKGGENNERG